MYKPLSKTLRLKPGQEIKLKKSLESESWLYSNVIWKRILVCWLYVLPLQAATTALLIFLLD